MAKDKNNIVNNEGEMTVTKGKSYKCYGFNGQEAICLETLEEEKNYQKALLFMPFEEQSQYIVISQPNFKNGELLWGSGKYSFEYPEDPFDKLKTLDGMREHIEALIRTNYSTYVKANFLVETENQVVEGKDGFYENKTLTDEQLSEFYEEYFDGYYETFLNEDLLENIDFIINRDNKEIENTNIENMASILDEIYGDGFSKNIEKEGENKMNNELFKATKTKGKLVEAYCFLDNIKELENENLHLKNKIIKDGNEYRLITRESTKGELINIGDYIKLDTEGFPYPNSKEFFEENHKKTENTNEYEQIPKTLSAYIIGDDKNYPPEIKYLIDEKGLNIDYETGMMSAPLWGDTEVTPINSAIIFYSIDCDEEGTIYDADFNFVAQEEFEKTYIVDEYTEKELNKMRGHQYVITEFTAGSSQAWNFDWEQVQNGITREIFYTEEEGRKALENYRNEILNDVYEMLDNEFHFTLDPCSTDENCKCKKHFTLKENGLKQNWGVTVVLLIHHMVEK